MSSRASSFKKETLLSSYNDNRLDRSCNIVSTDLTDQRSKRIELSASSIICMNGKTSGNCRISANHLSDSHLVVLDIGRSGA